MKCHVCGSRMSDTVDSVRAGWGEYTVVIEGVKMRRCNECGETLIGTREAKMIEAISRGFSERAGERPDVLNVEEVAAYLRVTPQTVYNMIRKGDLPAAKVGREWRFRRADIEGILTDFSVAARSSGYARPSDNEQTIMERHLWEMRERKNRSADNE